jgi:hypothetical protein
MVIRRNQRVPFVGVVGLARWQISTGRTVPKSTEMSAFRRNNTVAIGVGPERQRGGRGANISWIGVMDTGISPSNA